MARKKGMNAKKVGLVKGSEEWPPVRIVNILRPLTKRSSEFNTIKVGLRVG